jgi:uncharacterized membrane protein YdbT with pleckstrin-like domain|eukprot:COSAG03_NODE_109_length_12541_cov_147.127070_1_plen_193_part_00
MEKAELKQALQRALLQGMEAEDNALEGIRERLRSMGVDQMHSLLRQLFILQQAGVEPSLGLHSSSGGSEQNSSSTPALENLRAQAVSDAAAANQARLTAQDEANVAANADTAAADEEEDEDEDEDEEGRTTNKQISLTAALASKRGASRWLEQARAKARSRKLIAEDLKAQRIASNLATGPVGDAPAAAEGL